VLSFLKIGATGYGGPAILGIMQSSRSAGSGPRSRAPRGGLALVNVLPGATATQLAIFLGYLRGGCWGGLLAGLGFALPGFIVMLALTVLYSAFGVSPLLRGTLYGLGPVVVGIFVAALFRLGKSLRHVRGYLQTRNSKFLET
jgi:chromate transporter